MSRSTAAGLCATCSQMLSRCLACEQPVIGAYYEFDGTGPYCAECTVTREPCDVCGAPLTGEHWVLSDGRQVCAYCHRTAVYRPAEATALYKEMKTVVEERLGLKLNIPTGLVLVDRDGIERVIRRQDTASGLINSRGHRMSGRVTDLHPDEQVMNPVPYGQAPKGNSVPPLNGQVISPSLPDPNRTLGLYARHGMRRGIYIQTGLPRLLFLQVAAHEYAHAWQGENSPLIKGTRLHEGFAEWVAYHAIGYYGYSRGQERMLKRDDVYGDGLRWVLQIERQLGVVGLIETCQRGYVRPA